MAIKLAFCSDCDLQTWDGYRAIHGFLGDLGMPAGDSFWLFDPSGGEMGLFGKDCREKGPRHDELLAEIAAGRLDVLHSAGSYGARFAQGLAPQRELVAEALDYLAAHARVPKIWTNHGDACNIQNIGGSAPLPYHNGDLPGSKCYLMDLLLQHGFEHFWIDRHLTVNAENPARLVAQERTRSGHDINVFNRFIGVMPWAPNGQNFALQLNQKNFEAWLENDQNIILYQHWGCHHDANSWAYSPPGHPLTEESQQALRWLAERRDRGEVEIVRLGELLAEETAKPLRPEIDRIGRIHTRSQANSTDGHFHYQYHVHTFPYFAERIDHLDPRGKRALDAGCGVGQWTFAIADRFESVAAFDVDAPALAIDAKIAASARVENVAFSQQDIYKTTYPDSSFDFVVSFGVIFLVHSANALAELNRVMTPGAWLYMSVNGDGWYQYLVDERFGDSPDETREMFVECLWNAYRARCGGSLRLRKLGFADRRRLAGALARSDKDAVRDWLVGALSEQHRERCEPVMREYSPFIVMSLGRRVLEMLKPATGKGGVSTALRTALRPARSAAYSALLRLSGSKAFADGADIPLTNRPYLPYEFEAIAAAQGFPEFRSGPDASMSLDPAKPPAGLRPTHPPLYGANPRVWECLVRKSPGAA